MLAILCPKMLKALKGANSWWKDHRNKNVRSSNNEKRILRGLGVEEDAIQKIIDEHHEGLQSYKEKAEKVDSLKEQLDTANEEIKIVIIKLKNSKIMLVITMNLNKS